MTLNELLKKLDETQEIAINCNGGEALLSVCTTKQANGVLYDLVEVYLNNKVTKIGVEENTILINLDVDYTVNEEDLP